jgi:hypothetical protein
MIKKDKNLGMSRAFTKRLKNAGAMIASGFMP